MTGATAPAILFCGLDLRLRTHEGCETRSELRLRPHLFVIGSGSVWGQFLPIGLDFIANWPFGVLPEGWLYYW